MRRLIIAVIIGCVGCSLPDYVLHERQEALRHLQCPEEGLQADDSFCSCSHMSRMAPEQQQMDLLQDVALFEASKGFFEVKEVPEYRTIRGGYDFANTKQWACARFKGWKYVLVR